MIRKLSIAALLATVSGCASFAPPPPLMIPSQIEASTYKDLLVRLQSQQALYAERAGDLASEGGWINTFAIAGSLATLGFAAYDSPHDNIVAAALIGGAANTANTQLKPDETAAFYSAGASALGCVYSASRLVRSHYGELEAEDAFASPSAALTLYQAKRLVLAKLIDQASKASEAAAKESADALDALVNLKPKENSKAAVERLRVAALYMTAVNSAKLAEALASAREADAKLQLGITAQKDLVEAMATAMQDTHALVTKRSPPTLKSLLDAISKVELPKAEPLQPASEEATKKFKNFWTLYNYGSGKEFEQPTPAELAASLQREAESVKTLRPEKDAAGIKQIAACVVSFGAIGATPAD